MSDALTGCRHALWKGHKRRMLWRGRRSAALLQHPVALSVAGEPRAMLGRKAITAWAQARVRRPRRGQRKPPRWMFAHPKPLHRPVNAGRSPLQNDTDVAIVSFGGEALFRRQLRGKKAGLDKVQNKVREARNGQKRNLWLPDTKNLFQAVYR